MNKLRKLRINIPHITEDAEFPLVFMLIFVPSYLSQEPLPFGLFDYGYIQIQIIFQSLLILFLTLYLLQQKAPFGSGDSTLLSLELSIPDSLTVLGGLVILFSIYSFVVLPFLQKNGIIEKPEEAVLITKGIMLLPAFFTTLCAASMEEFFFRGYAFFRLTKAGLKNYPALFTVNILFASGHLYEGIPASVFAFLSGIMLSLFLKRGVSLFSLALAHGIFNFSMILISYFIR